MTSFGSQPDEPGRVDRTRYEPRGFAFDLDGTIYLGPSLLPGARELIGILIERGLPYVFATNNSSVPGEVYVERLTRLGLPVTRENVITSNDAAVAHLRSEGLARPYLMAPKAVTAEYAAWGIAHENEQPDSVLLAFDTTLDYEKIRTAAHFIRGGVPFLATHPDPICPTPRGGEPDVGAFIAMFEIATGKRPTVLGKPNLGMARLVLDRLGLPPNEIAFVGDRLETDILMAHDHGFVGILTLTGVTGTEQLATAASTPDLVIDDLHALLTHYPSLAADARTPLGSRRTPMRS